MPRATIQLQTEANIMYRLFVRKIHQMQQKKAFFFRVALFFAIFQIPFVSTRSGMIDIERVHYAYSLCNCQAKLICNKRDLGFFPVAIRFRCYSCYCRFAWIFKSVFLFAPGHTILKTFFFCVRVYNATMHMHLCDAF